MIEWKKWNDSVVPFKNGPYLVASGQNEDLEICELWKHESEWKWCNQNNIVRYCLESDRYALINLPGEE